MRKRHILTGVRLTFPYIAATVALGLVRPPSASACGGLFCSSIPVVQAGEQIVYVIDDDGSLTMSVRIYYDGAAPEFAWILPVPETPEISLGTAALFDALDGATTPYFGVGDYRTEGTCRAYPSCEYPPRPDAGPWWLGPVDAAAVASDAASGPMVFAESTLGPFETVVIGGSSATEIRDWLAAHGYDIPASSIPMLEEYVAGGQRFVALRLRTDASVDEIQPITLGFGGVLPCLPIRLTAIATMPDLPITAFFLADARATPRNYSLIETPFPASLFLGSVTYDQWVSNAADDLGGQAFIADYAGATPAAGLELPSVLDLGTATTAREVVTQLFYRGYRGDAQLRAILERFLPPPTGTDPASYYNCLAGFFGGPCPEPASFDAAGLAAAIDLAITQPRAAAQGWMSTHAYTTRLYTTMSAPEMTLDPEFVIDDGLDDVSNLHYATAVVECDSAHFAEDAAQHLELPDGTTAPYRPATPSRSDESYCAVRGGWLPGTPHDAGPSARFDAGMRVPGGGGGSGCSVSRGAHPSSLLVLLVLVGVARRRRS